MGSSLASINCTARVPLLGSSTLAYLRWTIAPSRVLFRLKAKRSDPSLARSGTTRLGLWSMVPKRHPTSLSIPSATSTTGMQPRPRNWASMPTSNLDTPRKRVSFSAGPSATRSGTGSSVEKVKRTTSKLTSWMLLQHSPVNSLQACPSSRPVSSALGVSSRWAVSLVRWAKARSPTLSCSTPRIRTSPN